MKQGTYINRLIMLLFFLALAAYLGVYAWQSLRAPFSSTLCYTYTVDDAAETTGWVVREEVLLPQQTGLVDILPEEGEKVAAGETVAVIYRDAEALERKNQIRQLSLELEQLEYSLRQDNRGGGARLDQDILAAIVALRGRTAAGNFSRLEEASLELKSLVLRRNYMYNNNAESVEGIQAMIWDVSARLVALRSTSNQETTRVLAPVPGVYSGQVDGLETVLTPQSVMELTPSALDKLRLDTSQVGQSQTGRLITSSRWYFAAPLSEADAARLTEGKRVTVRFSRDFTGEVSMLVERIGLPENGRVCVVFSSTRSLSQVTLLRRQTVELIFDSTQGIRVPKAALRLEETVVTDRNTGTETVVKQPGVYAVVGAQAEWKPVQILAEEEDFFLVESAPPKNQQNANETKKILRAGDEIILSAQRLYDGKVVK